MIEYAIKIIAKERYTNFSNLKKIAIELEVLRKVTCPNIIAIKDVLQTEKRLYLVTEKGGKDLWYLLDEEKDNGMPEEWAKDIITGVFKATFYCHSEGICHRDIKPENILVNFDREQGKCVDLKLCDFGEAAKIHPTNMLTSHAGTTTGLIYPIT